ncbi:phosphate signaling complex protein PhoU [Parabacteroides sp. PF5-6]|uniref:phosphate signaling complex protein PhoU n=1 Tax=Parabacteroides sp. PF5-6 TaxID=1742403 RepID=UPI002405DA92|nr:phosphate signaling complex protein PhoU [Parabacteroides sp. PF5-6]MDF9829708.1 phosphate transport system protein [Parabacteroides sp. PF5-6]
MKHTEKELINIRDEVNQMWLLVMSQLEKSKEALLRNDIELAREVISREKRVNTFELKIDSDCENYIALYNPVAIDLRLILSLIRIGSTLERIGDFAEGIARHVIEDDCIPLTEKLGEELQLKRMFDTLITMLSDSYAALEKEETKLSGKILGYDEIVDELYHKAIQVLAIYLQDNTADIECGLKTMILIRKLERIGDHCSNIVEEIVFYLDAKVLKHAYT